jgi:dinuclear metal center YbgI/SA1388 family protein
MHSLSDLCAFLESYAPPGLAAEWDNVGLLVGDRAQKVERVMTCLTITPASAAEAVRERVDLIVTHHPLPFRPLKRLTADQPAGRMLLDLIRAGIAIYSPHTAFDSAAAGINQQLAEGLGLTEIGSLEPGPLAAQPGAGRFGRYAAPQSLGQIAARVKQFLKIGGLHAVGSLQRPIERVAIACGSGGEFLSAAIAQDCQLLVTGEARFHTCLEAESQGVALLLAGHFASERFGVERLADVLATQFPALTIWPSRRESDPLQWI